MHPLGNAPVTGHLFGRNRDALIGRIGGGSQPIDHGLGNAGPGHDPVDKQGVAGRFEQEHPRHHRQAEGPRQVANEAPQGFGIHHHLGLDKAGAGGLLALDPGPQATPAGTLGISRRPGEQVGGTIGQQAADGIEPLVEGGHLLQQPHGLQLIHRPAGGLVARPHRIAGEAEQVGDAQGMGAEQVGLEGDAVAVTAGQLQHRLNALIQ